MKTKNFFLSRNVLIILFSLIQGIGTFYLFKSIPNDVNYNEFIFVAYRSSVLNLNYVYIEIAIMIYINIKVYNIYVNPYIIVKYNNISTFVKKIICKILINVTTLVIPINIIFLLVIFIMGKNYISSAFLVYICISVITQVLGLTVIFIFIMIINLYIRKLIISSAIIFGLITIFDSILRVLKSSLQSITGLIFYKSYFEIFYMDKYNQIGIGFFIIFSLIGASIILEKILKKRDFINENEK